MTEPGFSDLGFALHTLTNVFVVQVWQSRGDQAAADSPSASALSSRAYMLSFVKAYPEAVQLMAETEEAWQNKTVQVWLVPQTAVGGCKQAPQVNPESGATAVSRATPLIV